MAYSQRIHVLIFTWKCSPVNPSVMCMMTLFFFNILYINWNQNAVEEKV